MITLTRPELEHIRSFVDEFEAVAEADEEALIPLYLIERIEIIKQFLEEKASD